MRVRFSSINPISSTACHNAPHQCSSQQPRSRYIGQQVTMGLCQGQCKTLYHRTHSHNAYLSSVCHAMVWCCTAVSAVSHATTLAAQASFFSGAGLSSPNLTCGQHGDNSRSMVFALRHNLRTGVHQCNKPLRKIQFPPHSVANNRGTVWQPTMRGAEYGIVL